MNSRIADGPTKFFMVYNPDDKKFIRIDFQQPRKEYNKIRVQRVPAQVKEKIIQK